MPYRNAVSVLPDPVGAWIRTWPPAAIAGQPRSCGGVGASKVRSNHPRVAGKKMLSGSTRTSVPLRAHAKRHESVSFRARGALLLEHEVEHERDPGDHEYHRPDDERHARERERRRAIARAAIDLARKILGRLVHDGCLPVSRVLNRCRFAR